MKKLLRIVILNGLMLLMASSFADEQAKETLIERLEAPATLAADFEQITYKDGRKGVDKASGILRIAKPLQFAWYVTYPYDQQVISDGETLWVYDPDLEQATYQSLSNTIQQSPAMILAQPRRVLGNSYTVVQQDSDTLASYRLFPTNEDAMFTELTMAFLNNVISEIRLIDNLSQETVIHLTNVIVNGNIDPSYFEFNPPPGTDLFEQM